MLSDDAIISLLTGLISIFISLFAVWQRSRILVVAVKEDDPEAQYPQDSQSKATAVRASKG
ncbi:hypothetical protein B0O99DRAFT_688151 [Bisporella sp. PMI_857]|nr:hypothetical protein B0O99DRAFT_688151 [Bisporella sp. PMI_857]